MSLAPTDGLGPTKTLFTGVPVPSRGLVPIQDMLRFLRANPPNQSPSGHSLINSIIMGDRRVLRRKNLQSLLMLWSKSMKELSIASATKAVKGKGRSNMVGRFKKCLVAAM